MLFASIGAVLEWYDLMLYGYFAVVFSRVFFPDQTGLIELIQVYATFAVGYLMRPLGGAFFGWLGERYGRKVSLSWSISIMAVPLVVTAALPTYAQWGLAATLLLVLMRMLQGFSVGGEFSGTLVFLGEEAEHRRRGYLAAFATMYSGVGVLLAALVAAVITGLLSQDALDSWGWRIGYALGAVTAIVGIVLRRQMEETSQFDELRTSGRISRRPLRDALRTQWRPIVVVALLTVGNALLGATAPAVATALVHVTGVEVMPAFYLIAASVLILPVILRLRETAFDTLGTVGSSSSR